jgi:hypothetical protein
MHTNEGQKAKEETRQNRSPSSQSFTPFAMPQAINGPEYLHIREVAL